MPHSGLTSTTVDQLAMGPAIVYRGSDIIGTLGSSATVEEITEWRQPRIAGLSSPVEGLDRKVSTTLRITGEFLEHDADESAIWASGVNASFTVTPSDAGVLFTAGLYDSDIRFVMMLGNGDTFEASITSAIITGYPFAGEDPGEGASTVTFEARSTVASPDDAPYTYKFTDADELFLLEDQFNRANGAPGTADTGQAASSLGGSWSIVSNKLRSGAANGFISWECGDADVIARTKIDVVTLGSRVAVRLSDASNGILASADGANLVLHRYQATVYNSIGSVAYTVVAGDVLEIRANGNSISVYVNDLLKIGPVTESFNATVTKHGLSSYSGSDDFDWITVAAHP